MEGKDLITLVIHTSDRAVNLRRILESHGIVVCLEKLDMKLNAVPEAFRVRIAVRDLPLALRIMESGNGYSPALVGLKLSGMSGNVLIPVDFSSYSTLACEVGFDFARRLGLHPVLLHTFVAPSPSFAGVQSSPVAGIEEIEDAEACMSLETEAEKRMKEFSHTISDCGFAADVRFSTIVREGLPEEVIRDYARNSPPSLIVMATRGRSKKREEMIGSVTAEVIDTCRVPVFTVPEDYAFPGVRKITRLTFFCNVDEQDILSIDALMRMFDYPEVDVTLVPVNDKGGRSVDTGMRTMRECLSGNYPNASFSVRLFPFRSFRNDFEQFIVEARPELLVIPNRKKNVFSRLFNPSIAHRILFERDIPMLVLPV